MNNVLPARMGEFVRAHLGGRVTKQSRSVVLATIAAERLADGFIISLFFVLAMRFGTLSVESEKISGLYTVSWIFFAAVIGTLVVLLQRRRIFNFFEYLGQIMPGNISKYSLKRAESFLEGLEPLVEPNRALKIFSFSVLIWSVEVLAYREVAHAFGQTLGIAPLVLFLAVVNFSSLIPAAPGGIGVIEAVSTAVLVKIGIPQATAFSMVASQHLIQYLVVGLPGLFFFFKLRKKIEQLIEEQDDLIDEGPYADVSSGLETTENQKDPTLPLKSTGELLDFSLIIPAYNEEQRVATTLEATTTYLRRNYKSFEIIVVNDGSTDLTANVVTDFSKQNPEVRLLSLSKNRGKGYAVKKGIVNSLGKLVLFSDADNSSPIEESVRLVKAINESADIAIGSRARYSPETNVETVWYRKFLGRIFNGVVNIILLPGIADTQCGFKMFKRNTALMLFHNITSERFSFDVELLFLARKAGCKIAEVPINWKNIPGSKVNLLKDSAQMLKDVLLFRLKNSLGGYKSANELKALIEA